MSLGQFGRLTIRWSPLRFASRSTPVRAGALRAQPVGANGLKGPGIFDRSRPAAWPARGVPVGPATGRSIDDVSSRRTSPRADHQRPALFPAPFQDGLCPARLGAGEVAEAGVERGLAASGLRRRKGQLDAAPPQDAYDGVTLFREHCVDRAGDERVGLHRFHDRPPGMVRFVTPRHLRREAVARSDGTSTVTR